MLCLRGNAVGGGDVKSYLQAILDNHIRALGLPEPIREYRFHPTRRWRVDYAWPESKVMAEVEGGTWSGGRHTRGGGFEKDCEKYNAAALDGWFVYRFTGAMVREGTAAATLEEALDVR